VCPSTRSRAKCSSESSTRKAPAGVVELVAFCGLYAIKGYMVTAFDIPIEESLPASPF
jgi:hypothetical protein